MKRQSRRKGLAPYGKKMREEAAGDWTRRLWPDLIIDRTNVVGGGSGNCRYGGDDGRCRGGGCCGGVNLSSSGGEMSGGEMSGGESRPLSCRRVLRV